MKHRVLYFCLGSNWVKFVSYFN